jgi:hypothetical protein
VRILFLSIQEIDMSAIKPYMLAASLFLTFLSAPTLRAETFDQFTVTAGPDTTTFTLPASPTPSGTNAACIADLPPEFCISDVTVSVNGVAETGNTLEFFDISQLGGLAVTGPGGGIGFIDTVGAQLYSGNVSTPTFLLGTFDQTNFADGSSATVTISQVTPEPGSLVLLGSGMLGLVAIVRRRLLIT